MRKLGREGCFLFSEKNITRDDYHVKNRYIVQISSECATRKSLPPFSPPAPKFSYEEMINCHDSRGKGTVFLLMIYLALSTSCNFSNNPITSDYSKKIKELEGYLPPDYQLYWPRLISEGKKDQNCIHLLTLFLSNYSLGKIPPAPKLVNMIKKLQTEIGFVKECTFKIPSPCPDERVNSSIILKNLYDSLKALETNILRNFTHCLHLKCETNENTNELKSPAPTTSHDKCQHRSKEHTTPPVKHHDSFSDHRSGDNTQRSHGEQNKHLGIIILLVPVCLIAVLIIGRIIRRT
ncbi:fms-related tyrosine kinase 3 ligand isoform X2 [Dendropsophus ebraccatus]|uniref:fms-related tyrosine kinase 3 ligand isoform X2 n=1 Tax=Dendropsophus ebraccatus TaxID=150705 RepID=UPI00383231E7